MFFRSTLTTLVLLLLCVADIARATDSSGEYPGVYVLEGSRMPDTAEVMEELQLKCVLAPSVMGEDGKGEGYFLDRARYRSTGVVSYLKGQSYNCRYNAATRMETCDSKEWSDGKNLTYYRTNVYEIFTEVVQRGHSLLSPEDVVAWNSRKALNPDTAFAYHRCTCLTNQHILSLVSSALNPHSSAETGQYLYWWRADPDVQELELARSVREALGGCAAKLS